MEDVCSNGRAQLHVAVNMTCIRHNYSGDTTHLPRHIQNNVNSEIFARILISRIELKDIFETLKFRDYGILFPIQVFELFRNFARVLFSRNFAYAKFREN